MAQNIINEYLVKLGFAPTDTAGFARFAGTLREASSLVDSNVLRMAKKFAEFQVGVTAGFAAVGAAALGIVDKTAMADQSYRLLALHMYTSLPVARELKVALDALGQPLENVIWDPELAARFHQLVIDQQKMTEQLGPGFEKQMLAIRDVRFEFTRLGVELEYLTMHVVEDLAKAFGTTTEGALATLRHFNDWFIANIPYFSYVIATKLKPVLIDVYDVLKATGDLLLQVGGQLAGINWVAFIGDVAKGIEALTKLEKNVVLAFDAANKAIHGDYSGAWKDLYAMEQVTANAAPTVGSGLSTTPTANAAPLSGAGGAISVKTVRDAIVAQAKALGVPPELALSVAAQESSFKQFGGPGSVKGPLDVTTSSKGAIGMFQLEPGTAKDMGVDPADLGGNILGGIRYLAILLQHFGGNQIPALEKYFGTTGPLGQKYASDVIGRESGFTVNGDVNISVAATTNAKPDDIARAIRGTLDQMKNNKIQRNIGEFQTTGWSYP